MKLIITYTRHLSQSVTLTGHASMKTTKAAILLALVKQKKQQLLIIGRRNVRSNETRTPHVQTQHAQENSSE